MSTGQGHFFAIDRRVWAKVCDCGMNSAVAYLVLACGTGPENKFTSWSTTSVARYGGIGIERSKAAIHGLIREGIMRHGETHTKPKPRYELILPSPETQTGESDERIWLPKAIVTGTGSGETPPVHRLRSAGDLWALRLFVDLYCAQNLRDDGGISPLLLRHRFDRKRVGEHGYYNIWGFRSEGFSLTWSGPFAPHKSRPKLRSKNDHPAWESVEILQKMGLIAFVPHLYDNDSPEAEQVHPYGIGSRGEEKIETEIGEAADTAAREMFSWDIERAELEGFEWFCPVIGTLPKVQMIGIARLLYRPRTRRTAAWFGQLQVNGQTWLEKYRELSSSTAGKNSGNFRYG